MVDFITIMHSSKDFPPPEEVMEMEPEELAPFVLRFLKKQPKDSINRYNFTLPNDSVLNEKLGYAKYGEYRERMMEAWVWLEVERFIAPRPGQGDNWYFVTRKGQKVLDAENFQAYLKSYLFPVEIDAVLTRAVKPLFSRGDYDTAIFRAFKEVEMRVRTRAELQDEDYGVDLMKKAFGTSGPLENGALPKGERDRMRDLFVGAIGTFKNPSSHREVSFADPREAIDLICFANQLLRMVERTPTKFRHPEDFVEK